MSLSWVIAVEKWTRSIRSGPQVSVQGPGYLEESQKEKVDIDVSRRLRSRNQDLRLITQHDGSDWRGLRTEQGMEYGKGEPRSGNLGWQWTGIGIRIDSGRAGLGHSKPGAVFWKNGLGWSFLMT